VTVFESFLLEQLPTYYSNPTLTLLAASITICGVPDYVQSSQVISSFYAFPFPQAKILDNKGLCLFSLLSGVFEHGETNKAFLACFLTTEARSKHCFLNNQHYSIAAQQCFKYLNNNTSYAPTSYGTPHPSWFRWALDYLPTLLDRSSETEELTHYAESAQIIYFNSRGRELEYTAGISRANAAIARYLARCTKMC
jgi:hypothetical protein